MTEHQNGQDPRAAPGSSLIWDALSEIFDPEIPVVSVLDLGIVREVMHDGSSWHVVVTPTYSGCPAIRTIQENIRQMFLEQGFGAVQIDTRLAPAWTTDWMTERGREALRRFGIAPPAERAINVSGLSRTRATPSIACPRCGSSQTRIVSSFGSTACKALCQCRSCLETFDYFKSH